MSSGMQHPQRHRNGSNSRMSDVRDGKTLTTPHVQNGVPSHLESMVSEDTVSRYTGTHVHSRRESQSHDTYNHSKASRAHDSYPDPSLHQAVAGPSRHYHVRSSQQVEPTNPQSSQYNPHQRHPNLILDTRNLPNPRPSPITPSQPSNHSPSVLSELPISLHEDLTSLKSSLEALWNQSSKKLHGLHSALATQNDALHSLSVTKTNLESSIAQQQATLSQELERLSVENSRLVKDIREADESRKRALREREMLSEANARLWEDKARLEGEKRELRVKLDAETDFARLCRLELDKRKESQSDQGVKVKMEEDEDEQSNGGPEDIRVPLVQIEEIIEKRLRIQADEFTRAAEDVYGRLAQSQTHVTELQAQLKRYSTNTNAGGITPIAPQPPPHPNRLTDKSTSEETPPVYTPVTPHTAIPSSVSENDREHPFARMSSSRKVPGSSYQAIPSSASVRQAENRPAPPVGPREAQVTQRTVSGPVAHKLNEEDARPRRVSVPSLQATGLRSAPIAHAYAPNLDSGRGSERLADVKGQVVSTYTGVGAGWKPTALPSASTSRSHGSDPHSRPATPERPFKRARTAELPDGRTRSQTSPAHGDERMVTNSPDGPPVPPELIQQLEDGQPGRDMTADEHLMFTSLSRVLVKKRDNDGWKCVLCRQDKKSPTQTFCETTPIGVVTLHVKEAHKQFWKDLKNGGEQTATPAR